MEIQNSNFLDEAMQQFSIYQSLPVPFEVMHFIMERFETHIEQRNEPKILEYLTKLKWLPNFASTTFDPIKIAIKTKSLSILKTLVEEGFDPQRSEDCVKYAMKHKQFLSAIFLIEHGGIPDGITKENKHELDNEKTFIEFLE